ncbi:alanine racemase [Brevibacillus massiliensis]|uniref:alanine racemase n=1 Tax=Brevibacillus massiliensis TaxID=1118054 RepID=UPI0002E89DC3|nr:alanine racemase [Brevibacillus massiliensis]
MRQYCRNTWAEIDLDAIRANVQAFRRHIPERTEIMAVVKADGYGHGALQVGQEALASGASSLAVALLDEAIALRRAGITAPILVLGYTPSDAAEEALRWNIELTVYQRKWVQEVQQRLHGQAEQDEPLRLHVKVDTGMGRLGVRTEAELVELVEAIRGSRLFRWTGIFTHFACADEEDTSHVLQQHVKFQALLQMLQARGYQLPKVHCCNSAAAIVFPQWGYDMIRLGISLYGLYPSPYLRQRRDLTLTPALSLKTSIAHVKMPEEAYTVSYGATYTASAGEQVATLPVGYADGYSRMLSNRGYVLHRGNRVPIVGRVCMDQLMIKIEQKNAEVGDEVVLYGRQGDEEISLDEVAAELGTINYEVACMLNRRVPRVYLRDGKITQVANPIVNIC